MKGWPSLGAPQPKLDVLGSSVKVIVRAEQDKIVLKRELDEHGVDSSDLDTMTAASVADFGGFDMVLPIWLKKAECRESLDQLTTHLRPCKALEKFLQHKTCRKDLVRAIKCMPKSADRRR